MAKFRRKAVWQRAYGCCEYCRLPQAQSVLPHEIDHIRARKHHGPHTMDNTCVACAHCNGAKGANVAGYDPETDALVPLFDPRRDEWETHFRWDGPVLVGLTPVGRATIDVLNINEAVCVEQREFLIRAGLFPPNT